MKAFVFPQLELVFAAALRRVLERMGTTGVHVGSMKLDASKYPRQIIVNTDGGFPTSRLIKQEGWRINIWAPTRSEVDALAAAVEGGIPLLPSASRQIEHSSVGEGPIPVNDTETGEQQRLLTGTALMRGKSITLTP